MGPAAPFRVETAGGCIMMCLGRSDTLRGRVQTRRQITTVFRRRISNAARRRDRSHASEPDSGAPFRLTALAWLEGDTGLSGARPLG